MRARELTHTHTALLPAELGELAGAVLERLPLGADNQGKLVG